MVHFRLPGQGDQPASQALEAVLDDLGTAFRHRSADRSSLGALLELYGSIISLCARARRIRAVIALRSSRPGSGVAASKQGEPDDQVVLDDLRSDEVHQFNEFHRELLEFGQCLTTVNLAAIDIYFPGLRKDLMELTGRDYDFSYAYVKHIAPKYGFADRTLPSTLIQVLDRYNSDRGPANIGGQLMLEFGSNPEGQWKDIHDGYFYEHRDIPTQISVDSALLIVNLLEVCRDRIREIVRENWTFRDLLDRQSSYLGDIHVSKTEYNVSGSQVGAIGSGAHAQDMTFHQHPYNATGLDITLLAEQLERLQAELVRQASDRDHYAAVVAVSDAAAEAREGNANSAIAKLATVGRWAADVASKIGVTIATEAIKRAMG